MADVQNLTPERAIAPAWQAAFLAALRETGVVRSACEAANISRTSAYNLRGQDADFAAQWDDALQDAADLLESEAVRRARVGVREPVIYQGRPCGVWVNDAGDVVADNTPGSRLVPLSVTKYSDTLLIFLLKGIRPEKYKDNAPPDGGEAMGELIRELIRGDLDRRKEAGGLPGQPGGAGGGGPAPPVADAPAPAAH